MDKVKLSLDKVQFILLEVMRDYDAFCRENKLTYYMIGGTLLAR